MQSTQLEDAIACCHCSELSSHHFIRSKKCDRTSGCCAIAFYSG
ncbi:hypothetical protein [Microcoleus sp. FACHB-SPT15]|nr:hypothetical protein [Microcoleus sp. FACHB-SPT15]